jgi:uncharacterized protein YggU (UPF0235/DUF167 family)
MRLAVRVTPRGGRDTVEGWTRDGGGRPILKVRVAAAAADGQANVAVVALLARALGVPRSVVLIARGGTARVKQLEIGGVDEANAFAVLGAPPRP